jgi:hypothetical protein
VIGFRFSHVKGACRHNGWHPLHARALQHVVSRPYCDVWLQQSRRWPKSTLCFASSAHTACSVCDSCVADGVVGLGLSGHVGAEYVQVRPTAILRELVSATLRSARQNINLPSITLLQDSAKGVAEARISGVACIGCHNRLNQPFRSLIPRAFDGEL